MEWRICSKTTGLLFNLQHKISPLHNTNRTRTNPYTQASKVERQIIYQNNPFWKNSQHMLESGEKKIFLTNYELKFTSQVSI